MIYEKCKELFLNYIKSYCAAETLIYYETNFRIFEKYLKEIQFTGTSDFINFRRSDFIGYVAYLRSKSIKNTSVRTYCRAVRAFLKFLHYEGIFPEDITQRVKYPKNDKAVIIPLTNARVARLENSIKACSMGTRNLLIFHLCLDCGLRCSEVCSLRLSDVDFQNNFIKICNTKNNKSRILPLPVLVGDFIREYSVVVVQTSGLDETSATFQETFDSSNEVSLEDTLMEILKTHIKNVDKVASLIEFMNEMFSL